MTQCNWQLGNTQTLERISSIASIALVLVTSNAAFLVMKVIVEIFPDGSISKQIYWGFFSWKCYFAGTTFMLATRCCKHVNFRFFATLTVDPIKLKLSQWIGKILWRIYWCFVLRQESGHAENEDAQRLSSRNGDRRKFLSPDGSVPLNKLILLWNL